MVTDTDALAHTLQGNVVPMKYISNPRSVGIAKALLVLKLCFPLDLWSLWGVGRSLCDYCLHADLYLTFNYLRGSATCWCQYTLSIGSRRWEGGEKEPSLVSVLNRDPLRFWQRPCPPRSRADGCLWHSYTVWDLKGGFMEIWSRCPLDMHL